MNVYVGTYHKYNCGSLEGEWINLDLFENKKEFLVACYDLHKDEDDPELMFQDFDSDSEWQGKLYGESYLSNDYWEIKAELENTGITDEVFSAWASIHSEEICVASVSRCQEQYQGQWESLPDYVQNWYEETGDINLVPESLRSYIDFESIARDWEYGGDISIQSGYVFSR